MNRGTHRVLRAGAALAACALCVLGGSTPAAVAAEPPGSVSVQLTPPGLPVQVQLGALTPRIPRPGGTLVVDGTIRNTGTEDVSDITVRLRVSQSPLLNRGELQLVADGQEPRSDAPVSSTSVTVDDLAVGAAEPFAITVPLDSLGLDRFGVYPLGVEVRGATDGGQGGRERQGLGRTFLPWAPDPLQSKPTQLAWLWPIVDRPHQRADGVFIDDELAAEIAPGGRLARLVAAVTPATRVTWAIDPMLLDDLVAMSDGYLVATDGGTAGATTTPGADATPGASPPPKGTVVGTGAEAARTFLQNLRAAVASSPADGVIALPYGDPDVVAATHSKLGALVPAAMTRARALAAQVLQHPVSTSVALPPGGYADAAGIRTLAGSGVKALVLSANALPAPTAPYTLTGRGHVALDDGALLPVALFDPVLSSLAAGDAGLPGSAVLTEQRFLAETAMITAERPGIERTILVAPPEEWNPSSGEARQMLLSTSQAPWVEQVPLATVLDTPEPQAEREPLSYPAEAAAAELPAAYLNAVRSVVREVVTVRQVLVDTGPLDAEYQLQRLRLLSAGLRGESHRRVTLLDHAEADLDRRVAGISIVPPRGVQLSSTEQSFPISIRNDLDEGVEVRLKLTSQSNRLVLGATDPVRLGPHSRVPVLVPATALANGRVEVSAQLMTTSGRTFGTPVAVAVQVARYSGAALAITVGAGLLLFLAAARNVFVRVRASRHPPAHPEPDAPEGVPADLTTGSPRPPAPPAPRPDRTPTHGRHGR